MARHVYFHIGPPKTGTTFLQAVVWKNKPLLRQRGLLLPLGGVGEHYWALQTLRDEHPDDAPQHERTAWTRMLRRIADFDGDALISHEVFTLLTHDQSQRAVTELAQVCDSYSLVITCRDLARQMPSHWQQKIKQGWHYTFDDFVATADDDEAGNWFGRNQDLRRVIDRWQHDLPDHDVHLVTLPAPGGSRDALLPRFCAAIGLDPSGLDTDVAFANPSLGTAEAELLRRTNAALPPEQISARDQVAMRIVLGDRVLATREGERPRPLSPEHRAWAVERSHAVNAYLRSHDFTVHGTLDDLVVDEDQAQPPYFGDPVDDSALLDVAVDVLKRSGVEAFHHGLRRGEAAAGRREPTPDPRPGLLRRLTARSSVTTSDR